VTASLAVLLSDFGGGGVNNRDAGGASANVVPAAHSALLCFAVPGGRVMCESLTCGGCDRKSDEAKRVLGRGANVRAPPESRLPCTAAQLTSG
jgi:hypothetical protein